MNWIDILWAMLTFASVTFFVCGTWASHYKLRLMNYILIVCIIIYCMETMQTITHLTMPGYLFRMLTWVIQASYIALSVYQVWQKPWLKYAPNGLNCAKISITLMLMSCLSMLVLK